MPNFSGKYLFICRIACNDSGLKKTRGNNLRIEKIIKKYRTEEADRTNKKCTSELLKWVIKIINTILGINELNNG